MASAEYVEMAQEFYVAYYGRPGDPSGVEYWADRFETSTNLDAALDAFGASDEFTSNYSSMTNEELVDSLYQQSFGRAAEAEGLAFYVDLLETGDATLASIAKQIVDGAQNDDAVALANKVEVAQAYTAKVTELGADYTEDDIADAQAILAAVDATDASVTDGIAAAEEEVESNVPSTGETFMLTTSTDEFIGTTGDDTFTATQATYGTADFIFDQSSTDDDTFTLTTTSNITTATPTVKNVENFNVEIAKVSTFVFAADNITGTNTFTFNRSDLLDGAIDGSGDVTVTGANDATYVAGTQVADFSVTFGANDAASTVDATAATGDVAVAGIDEGGVTVLLADDQAVALTGVADAVATVVGAGDIDVDATGGIDNLTLEATDETTFAFATGALLDAVTLAGASDITVEIDGDDLDGVELENTATGVVNVVVTAVSTADMDLSDLGAVTSVELGDDFGTTSQTITVNSDQLITTEEDQGVKLTFLAGESNATARFAVLDDVAITAVDFGDGTDDFDTVELDATAGELAITNIDVNDADIILTGAEEIDLGTVANAGSIVSASTGDVILTTTGNVANEQTIALGAGDDDVTVNSATGVFVVNLGAGDNTLTVATAELDSQFVMGAGDDTVTLASTISVGDDLIVVTGAGDDELTLDSAETHSINLGDGANTLTVTENATATDATLTLGTGANTIKLGSDGSTDVDLTGATITGNVDNIDLLSADDLALTSAQFTSFGAFTLDGIASSSLTVTGTATANTIDGSVITPEFGAAATVNLDGAGGDDTITTSKFATVLTGGAGDDTFVFASGTGNTSTIIDEIVDFTTGDDVIKTGTAGSATNLVTSTGDTDLGTALTAANTAFDGTVKYFHAYDLDGNSDGGDSYLYIDWNLDGTADQAILLTGVDAALTVDDIIA